MSNALIKIHSEDESSSDAIVSHVLFFKNAISPSEEVNAKGCIVFGRQKYHQ
jgi:hypothetical protein